MKTLLLVLAVLASSLSPTLAQNVKQRITDEACKCIEDIIPSTSADTEQLISDCIQQSLVKNMKALAKESGVNQSEFNGAKGKEVGKEIGVMLATDCREFRNLMGQVRAAKEEKERLAAARVTRLSGKLKKIKGKPLTYITFKDDFKRTHELLLLSYFEGASELVNNFKQLKKRRIRLVWKISMIYDGTEGAFIEVKELIGME